MEKLPSSDPEVKKRNYFGSFARARLSHLQPHKEHGVLKKSEGWRNVAEHCLLEAVMADVLAKKLGLSEEEREQLVTGVLLHDYYKKEQIKLFKEQGATREVYGISDEASSAFLKSRGYSEEVIAITQAAGDVRKMALEYGNTTFLEKVMFYVDNIVNTKDNYISTIDERINAFQASGKYKEIDEEDRKIFGGVTHLETQRRMAKDIQKEIARKLNIEDPETLPEWIEAEIKKRIEAHPIN